MPISIKPTSFHINNNGTFDSTPTLVQTSGAGGQGVSEELKQALLQLAQKTAYIDDQGAVYYKALHDALYPPTELVSITAVYTQSGTVYTTTPLDDLKTDLVVTGTYDDQSTATIPASGYTLSGTLTEGTSTITVSYSAKTTTFTVTVTSAGAPLLYSWDFTQSLVDSVSGLTATATATQDSNGLTFSEANKYIEFPGVFQRNRTYEIDVVSIQLEGFGAYSRIWIVDADPNTGSGGSGYIIAGKKKGGDLFYLNGGWESNVIVSNTVDVDGSYYNNSVLAFQVDANGYISVYKDGVLLGTSSGAISSSHNGQNVYIGGSASDYMNVSRFSAYRIYQGAKY